MAAVEFAMETVVEPDYFQFYARRSDAEWASDKTTSAGYEMHLWSDGLFVVIGTYRKFGSTLVGIQRLDSSPPVPDESWQHVAEVSLRADGPLEVFDWANDVPTARIDLRSGPVRLRVQWRGLVPGRFEGLDDVGSSEEQLRLQVWPADVRPPAVLRWWSGWRLPGPTDRSPDGRRQVEGLEAVMDALRRLRIVASGTGARHVRMPGGSESSSVHAVLADHEDGTWWVDGYDVRRTVREVSELESRLLIEQMDLRRGDPADS